MGTYIASDKLGFDRPGALTRYFAGRWLIEPSAKGEQLIAWLLEAALGRNAMYFIERTKEYVDRWGGRGEIVPENAFDGFAITGDPVEDTLIPHAVLVWTCMNDRPWGEEVYHRWLEELLAAGSAEAAYLAASLWPAHDLMAKVTYRPAGWLVYRGRLDAEAERVILTEMLKGEYGPRTSLYGSFNYDNLRYPEQLPEHYIERHGFTHPICGLVELRAFKSDHDLKNRIQEALAASSWSEGMKGAAMLLYLSLNAINELRNKRKFDLSNLLIRLRLSLDDFENLSRHLQELLNTLEQNLFKLDERHINIINFHIGKIEKIDYNLIKDHINYIIILYIKIINDIDLSIKIFSKYMSIGLRTKDILYIGKDLVYIIFYLILKEKEKVESWLEKQVDDLRIKDILLAAYISKIDYYIMINEELKTMHVEKKIEDIYGKIKFFDKIRLFIDQARIYFEQGGGSHKVGDFIDDILKRNVKINFNCNFRDDYVKMINSWHPKRRHFLLRDAFLESNHIGLYLYYSILKEWESIISDFIYHTKEEKEIQVYLRTKDKIIENLYVHKICDKGVNINLYLNKIENNNFPYEEVKHKLIIELINIIENYYNEVLEYFKDESKLIKARKLIFSNIGLLKGKLRDPRLIDLLGIDGKSKNMIIY